jgi:hypothetical protein
VALSPLLSVNAHIVISGAAGAPMNATGVDQEGERKPAAT